MFWNTRWDPVAELSRFQQRMDDVFAGASGAVHAFPPVNVWHNGEGAIVTAELPGCDIGDIEISIHGDTLTLRGSRKPEELKEGEQFHRRERVFGQFSRTLTLPFRADAERAEAKFNSGVLSITLPRAVEDKPRNIAIKAAE